MPKCDIELFVEVQNGNEYNERKILITDYTYKPGMPAIINRAPEDCSPGEAEGIEDVECKWEESGDKLTDSEFEEYQEAIEEACFNHVKGE